MSTESDPDPNDTTAEVRGLLASARALLQELVEEDVDRFEPRPALHLEASSRAPSGKPAAGAESAAPLHPPLRRPPRPPPTVEPARIPAATGPATAPFEAGDRPSLEAVRAELGDCRRCALCEGRSTIVFGDGHPDADLLFIGEGPGEQEDRQGLPFVGRAGELLTQMIEKGIGIPRREVYICNIVKCRPPHNRNPLPPEVSACRPFLDGQIRAVAPKVIVTLGKPAASLLLGRDIPITRVRGTWHEYRGIPLMPTLHPAYVLRQYTPENRRAVWEDLKAAYDRSRS